MNILHRAAYALTSTRFAVHVFVFGLAVTYVLVPLTLYAAFNGSTYMAELAALAVLVCIAIYAGNFFDGLDWWFAGDHHRIRVDARLFHGFVWGSFLTFLVIVLLTADAVPLWSAIKGATAPELDAQRGAFLKLRSGWAAALPYISGIYTGVLLPYSLALLLLSRARGRFTAFFVFMLYSLSFLQKALFIQVITPPLYLTAQRKIWNFRGFGVLLAASAAIMYVITVLATGISSSQPSKIQDALSLSSRLKQFTASYNSEEPPVENRTFFSAKYHRANALEQILWRACAVPVFTAADSLQVFHERHRSVHFWGATSTALSTVFRLERVPFEKNVFAFQWTASELGSSNAVFIIEAFVNYGLSGVLIFGLFVGQTLRWFALSRDDAFKAMWVLWCYNIFIAGMIGTLLSNGYALLLLLGLFVTMQTKAQTPRRMSWLVPSR